MRYMVIGVLCLSIIPNVVMAEFKTEENSNVIPFTNGETSKGPELFRCIDLPSSVYSSPSPPPLNSTAATAESEAPPALCPPGQVPQPENRFSPKGRLIPPSGEPSKTDQLIQAQTSNYFYSAAYQYYNSIGTAANFTQPSPYLATSDYHTLAEIAAESADSLQIVEIGWTVDRGVNGGSDTPHLFTFHWVNGNATCYNGCGYVQVSGTRYPGMPVSVTTTPQQYAIEYYAGNWWIWYQSEWIGYFPGSLWGGTYTQAGLTQWFGEVSASSTKPCTDMGNGLLGTNSDAAGINNIFFINGPYASLSFNNPTPSYYTTGNISGSNFKYGGPGGC